MPFSRKDVKISICEKQKWDWCTEFYVDLPNDYMKGLCRWAYHEIFEKGEFKIVTPQFATSWLANWRVEPSPWTDMTEEEYGWVIFETQVGDDYVQVRLMHNSKPVDPIDDGSRTDPGIRFVVSHTYDGLDYTKIVPNPRGIEKVATVFRFLTTLYSAEEVVAA